MIKRAYFNDLAPRWNSLPGPPDAPQRIERFVELVEIGSARRVLDVGCGTGVLLEPLKRALGGKTHIIELDVALEMLKEGAREGNGFQGLSLCADARAIPLAAESVDAVLCFNALPHFEPPEAAVAEMFRVLRPGGVLGVGHLMESSELNAFHSSLHPAVAADRLPPSVELAEKLRMAGASSVTSDERPGWYFVRAVKA